MTAREADVLNADVDSFMQSVVENLTGQGIYPTSDEIQATHDALVADLQAALDQVVGSGLYGIEQQILGQVSGTTAGKIQAQNRYIEYAERVCAGIGVGDGVFAEEPVALFFGTVSFGLWALNAAGMFD